MSSVAALILAAGASTRMGAPKAMIKLQGRSFLERLGCSLLEAGYSPIIVLRGASQFPVTAPLQALDHPEWNQGPLSSLQRGIRALPDGISGALQCPVDRPRIASQTLSLLRQAHLVEPDFLWQPRYAGRSGHPLLWPRCLWPQLLSLDSQDPSLSARTLIRSASVAPLRRYLDVQDPTIHDNFDRPEDLPLETRDT